MYHHASRFSLSLYLAKLVAGFLCVYTLAFVAVFLCLPSWQGFSSKSVRLVACPPKLRIAVELRIFYLLKYKSDTIETEFFWLEVGYVKIFALSTLAHGQSIAIF